MFINLRAVALTHLLTLSLSLSTCSNNLTAEEETCAILESTSIHYIDSTKDNGRGTPSSYDGAGGAAVAAEPGGCLFQYVYAMLHALDRIRVFCFVLSMLCPFCKFRSVRSIALSLSFFFLSFSLSLSLFLSLSKFLSLCVF